jgi:YceI-like domain
MSIEPGKYELGPENGTLRIRTGRRGGAAKAGHDLLIEVTSWKATIDASAQPAETRLSLSADPQSMRVLEGTGGMMTLGDSDKDGIRQTIDEEILKGTKIEFRSTDVRADGNGGPLHVSGELDLVGKTAPVSFTLQTGENGRVTGSAKLTQSDWGIKPYSALFGALKVADELEVEFGADLPTG